jgi:parallel beta-helix repeat protein
VGPQSTIQCPANSVDILPTDSVAYIQGVVDANPGATTFCFRAGTHLMDGSITPKTGNTFVGEFRDSTAPAGRRPTTRRPRSGYDDPNDPNDPNGPSTRHHQNLVIRNMPLRHPWSHPEHNNWTIANNEIASGKIWVMFTATHVPNNTSTTTWRSSSPTPIAGRGWDSKDNTIVDGNEIAYNGPNRAGLVGECDVQQQFRPSQPGRRHLVRLNNNAVAALSPHSSKATREDNGRIGIVFESSIGATIRNNAVRRNAGDAVFISMSQNAQIYSNTLEDNFGGIEYFLNCPGGTGGSDLRDNAAYDNTIVVGTQSYTFASGFNNLSQCTSTELAPYLNGSKNLTFSRNTYHVPSPSLTRYFLWGNGWTGVYKDWNQWQALGSTMSPPQSLQDVGGSIISP